MSKKGIKFQASSARAAFGADGRGFGLGQGPFRSSSTTFGSAPSSVLSYVYEPPALNLISDPNVIVALKNVQKKDGTTKAKALEDLQIHVESSGEKGIQEEVLEAWIKLYPRTSIDSSRRVRQLAHIVHGRIAKSCGKRLAKHMPATVSSWLAGAHDPDKAVSRAAGDSFDEIFANNKKAFDIWSIYHKAILEYVENIIVNETESSLSDIKSTSADEASSKHTRVVGCALDLLSDSIDWFKQADIEKSHSTFASLLGREALWELAEHNDRHIRGAVFRVLISCLKKLPQMLNSRLLSTYIVSKGLHASQRGCSWYFVESLVRLTKVMPTVWTSDYQGVGKKSASHRLSSFLRKGSQGAPAEVWSNITLLLKLIPEEVIFSSSVDTKPEHMHDTSDSQLLPVLEALRAGVTNKEEPQSNATLAWSAYLDFCELINAKKAYASSKLVQDYLFPLVGQLVRPSPDHSNWSVPDPQQQMICVRACEIAFYVSPETSHDEWRILSSKLVEDLQISLPEQSKDYIKSQDSIAEEALRFYRLQAALIERSPTEPLMRVIRGQVVEEINAAISILKTRNGKPYGVAAALAALVATLADLLLKEASAKHALITFAEKDVPRLMLSPSAPKLVLFLDAMENFADLGLAYLSCIENVEGSVQSPAGEIAMTRLLISDGVARSGLLSTAVHKLLTGALDDVTQEHNGVNWSLVAAALLNSSAPKELTNDILSTLTRGISTNESSTQATLHHLENTLKYNRTALSSFATDPRGSELISKLLFLSEGPESAISQKAKTILKEMESMPEDTGKYAQKNIRSLLPAIQKAFRIAGSESLSIKSLVGQAEKLLKQTPETEAQSMVGELLPKPDDWEIALEPFLKISLGPSLAMDGPFGAAILDIRTDTKKDEPEPVDRDPYGRSVLLRILLYVAELNRATDLVSQASEELRVTLLYYVALTLALVDANHTVFDKTLLWTDGALISRDETAEFVTDALSLLTDILRAAPTSSLTQIVAKLLKGSEGCSPSSYYNAQAYLSVIKHARESKKEILLANSADRIRIFQASPNIFTDIAVLLFRDRKEVVRPINDLVSRLTDQKFEKEKTEGQPDGLRMLLLMNGLLRVPDIVHEISHQRLIFYVQHAIGEAKAASFATSVEILRSLIVILPAIKDTYGSFWGEALDFIKTIREYPLDDTHLMGYFVCAQLCNTLAKPDMLEANDDLLEAWTDRKRSITHIAVAILEKAALWPDERDQPRGLFNEVLCQLLDTSDQLLSEEVEKLFPVMASESITFQQKAFTLLHRQIPSKQGQVSLDRALTKDYEVNLPEELLSLILSPPGESELLEPFEYKLPSLLQSYVLSWILIFDHWKNASSMLQADYAKCLTEGTYLTDLLDTIFTILIDAGGKTVDVSRYNIESYELNWETGEQDVQWILSHLYFLALKYLPTQSKAWWRDNTSRQINIAVEAWTQKYVSKHIIASELDTVREWGPSQTDGDQPVTIKVLSSANEITASIPVDEDSMALAIRLPPSYPLARAEVESVRRVGVSEKKWLSWIRNTQGQLTIASEGGANALIDCLLTWRRNVTATMKGQTECAICYSVVGVDRTLPSKVCRTCKNKFHGSCLFRWFSSSNSSSCPLCRNTFTYS